MTENPKGQPKSIGANDPKSHAPPLADARADDLKGIRRFIARHIATIKGLSKR
jgi:hypothetical protein